MSSDNVTLPWSYQAKASDNATTSGASTSAALGPLFAKWFIAVVSPVIVLAGTFGNLMVIMVQRRLSSSSGISVFFTSLAAFDFLFLICATLRQWLEDALGIYVLVAHSAVCKIGIFLTLFLGDMSAWLLVAMTFSRATSVAWPHRAGVLCSPRRSKLVVLGLAIFMTALNAHNLVGYEVLLDGNRWECDFTDPSYAYFRVYVWTFLTLLVMAILPFLCLLFSNGVLIWKLTQSVGQAKHALGISGKDVLRSRQTHALSLSVTLICVSAAFCLFNVPFTVVRLYQYAAWVSGDRGIYLNVNFYYMVRATVVFWSVNAAVDFYIYLITGTKFRNEFVAIFTSRSATQVKEANGND